MDFKALALKLVAGVALVSVYILTRGSEVSLLVVSDVQPSVHGSPGVDWTGEPEKAAISGYTAVLASPEKLDRVLEKTGRVLVLPDEVIKSPDLLEYLQRPAPPCPAPLPQLALFAGAAILSTIGTGGRKLAGGLMSVSLVLYVLLSLALTLTSSVAGWTEMAQEAMLITALASGIVHVLYARAQHSSL